MKTPKQALAELEKGKPWPIYYLYGDEPFKINEFAGRISQILFGDVKAGETTFCIDRIDGATSTGSDVLEAVQSVGLFGAMGGGLGAAGGSRFRLVLVRQAHQLKEVDPLAEVLMKAPKDETPFGENVLVFVAETLDGRRKFHQWIKKQGYALEFKPARDAELLQWVHYLAKKLGATVAPDAEEMLAVLSQGSLHRLAQEVEKAWLYAGGEKGTVIRGEHVSSTASNQMAYEMVELVKSILEGKRTRALLLTEKLIQGSEDALGLVGFLTWAIKNPGRGVAAVASVGGAASGERRRRLVDALVDLDFRLKSSGMDAPALVEQFVIEQTQL